MNTKTVAIIVGPTLTEAKQQIQQALSQSDAFELRLDKLKNLDTTHYQALMHATSLPFILTLRTKAQGGEFAGNEQQQLTLLSSLLASSVQTVDLSYEISQTLAYTLKQRFPTLKLIRSYHNFSSTPENLPTLLHSLKDPLFDYYKLVTFARSSLDALRLLNLLKQQDNLIAHAMGEYGQFSRILASVCGSLFCYGAVSQQNVAPGLVPLEELHAVYNISQLNKKTKIYALLGDPVAQSIGALYHNKVIREQNFNAVYVKIKLKADELNSFFKLITPLPFQGFSVTMPLKQAIVAFLQDCDPTTKPMQAINTLVKQRNQWYGLNTDGQGAVRALQSYFALENKRILILGAGGSGRALAACLQQSKAQITLLNRTASKAHTYAETIGCIAGGLHELDLHLDAPFDAIINTLPVFNATQPWQDLLQTHPVVMNLVYNQVEDPWKKLAKTHHCPFISGRAMFYHQAQLQRNAWDK